MKNIVALALATSALLAVATEGRPRRAPQPAPPAPPKPEPPRYPSAAVTRPAPQTLDERLVSASGGSLLAHGSQRAHRAAASAKRADRQALGLTGRRPPKKRYY
jgi:hypothetical protein